MTSLHALIAKWRTEADEIDADGDVCCALTRRHDADELEAALAPVIFDQTQATKSAQDLDRALAPGAFRVDEEGGS